MSGSTSTDSPIIVDLVCRIELDSTCTWLKLNSDSIKAVPFIPANSLSVNIEQFIRIRSFRSTSMPTTHASATKSHL